MTIDEDNVAKYERRRDPELRPPPAHGRRRHHVPIMPSRTVEDAMNLHLCKSARARLRQSMACTRVPFEFATGVRLCAHPDPAASTRQRLWRTIAEPVRPEPQVGTIAADGPAVVCPTRPMCEAGHAA
jgi:hypothetical protein